MDERVSVYVPCYNGEPWLQSCLSALIDQSRPPDELLVIDDGSTDASASIASA
ncbi:MAG: glycosyltransferase, partial [Chloroflexi bacterium]|nr:glycosyltransferase [Chloroflexota bacterium]